MVGVHGLIVAVRLTTTQVIFVFVSDIGVLEMEQLLGQYASRHDIPATKFENVVKRALDEQWRRLNFGKVIDKVRMCMSLSLFQSLRVCV